MNFSTMRTLEAPAHHERALPHPGPLPPGEGGWSPVSREFGGIGVDRAVSRPESVLDSQDADEASPSPSGRGQGVRESGCLSPQANKLLRRVGVAGLFLALIGVASAAVPLGASAQAPQKKEPNPFPKPAKPAGPRHDPPDMPFRCAPMSVATRSVIIPLATNIHIAFDTELLRTHVAWKGETLNLWSAVYHGAKDRFYCDFNGTVLWTNAPVFAWSVGDKPSGDWITAPPGARYLGLSTKGGATTLMYELELPDGERVRIHETPRLEGGKLGMVVRRFEISASRRPLFVFAVSLNGYKQVGGIPIHSAERTFESTSCRLKLDARGAIDLHGGYPDWLVRESESPMFFMSQSWTESTKQDSVSKDVTVLGPQKRMYLHVPAHSKSETVEFAVAVGDSGEGNSGSLTWDGERLPPPNLAFVTNSVRASEPAVVKVVPGDKSFQLPGGDEFYRIERFPLPKEIELLVTGMDFLPNGDLAVCTWLGDVWIVEKATGAPAAATYRRFARGLCEPNGLRVIDGKMYVVQKQELTRITDTDGNGEADLFECISQDWGFTGNYHDFSFGPVVDKAGNFHVLRTGNRGVFESRFHGWDLAIDPKTGKATPVCSGMRSPDGFGTYGPDKDIFMTDNQGNWIGANKLNHLRAGKFYGFPSSTPASRDEFDGKRKDVAPPAVWFPYSLVKSASGIETISTDKFGPFAGQMLVGDFQNAIVTRVFLEKVSGEWQGAVWPMMKGFGSGTHRLAFGPDGRLYVGGLKNAAWAAIAPKETSLDRVTWTGKVPFEVKEARATRTGFELAFTQPVDAATAGSADSFDVAQYTYLHHTTYGSPEIDHDGKKDSSTAITVKKATVSADKLKVTLTLEGWKPGYVTLVRGLDVTSAEGRKLWHDTFYYTLNQIPK